MLRIAVERPQRSSTVRHPLNPCLALRRSLIGSWMCEYRRGQPIIPRKTDGIAFLEHIDSAFGWGEARPVQRERARAGKRDWTETYRVGSEKEPGCDQNGSAATYVAIPKHDGRL